MKFFNIFKKRKNKLDKKEIEKLDYIARKESEYYYSLHLKRLKELNPDKIDFSNFKPRKLNSIELNFLKYLNKIDVDNPNIAGYWTHEYNINYSEVLKQFLGQGLLRIHDEKDLHTFKVAELKQILSSKSLSKTGKKEDLINRIHANFTPSELSKYIKSDKRYYKLTSKGKEMVKTLKPSATKNLDLEDKCYSLIIKGEINKAHKKIAKYESQKPIPRGVGIDWKDAYINGLDKTAFINYTDHLNLTQELPSSLSKYQKQINAVVILGDMLGVSLDKICKLFLRIVDIDTDKNILYKCIHTNYRYLSSKKEILLTLKMV